MTQPLDLLSTSQTIGEIPQRCAYGAPLVAICSITGATIKQACCNHWDCPRCGIIRARQEYRRIVDGATALEVDHDLYFWTLTCRGKECTLEEAEEKYYAWTNVLLTNARTDAGRHGLFWAYVQVTERQHKNRNHPHSHIITTFCPRDALLTHDEQGREILESAWFARANYTAGLGSRHKISKIRSAAAVSRYVAKYMFKDVMREKWPPRWKRVRYSQNWPKLPEFQPLAMYVLNNASEWRKAGLERVIWVCEDDVSYEMARHRIGNIILRVT